MNVLKPHSLRAGPQKRSGFNVAVLKRMLSKPAALLLVTAAFDTCNQFSLLM